MKNIAGGPNKGWRLFFFLIMAACLYGAYNIHNQPTGLPADAATIKFLLVVAAVTGFGAVFAKG